MYTAIVRKKFEDIERLIDEGFDMNTIVMPQHSLTALGID